MATTTATCSPGASPSATRATCINPRICALSRLADSSMPASNARSSSPSSSSAAWLIAPALSLIECSGSLEVVARGVGEALELGVRALELRRALVQRHLGLDEVGDVADHGQRPLQVPSRSVSGATDTWAGNREPSPRRRTARTVSVRPLWASASSESKRARSSSGTSRSA